MSHFSVISHSHFQFSFINNQDPKQSPSSVCHTPGSSSSSSSACVWGCVCARARSSSRFTHPPPPSAGPSTLWLWAASAPLGSGPAATRSWARGSCREACCGATWVTGRWWDPVTWRAACTTRPSWSTPHACLGMSPWWFGTVPAG